MNTLNRMVTATCLVLATAGTAGAADERVFTLVVSGDRHGELAPCG